MTEFERRNFFGRRHGKALRAGQKAALEVWLPKLLLDLKEQPPADPTSLFDAEVSSVCLEIGFGGGEFLWAKASRNPHIGYIGVEPFVNGMAKLLSEQQQNPLGNLRLYNDDATQVLDWLPAASLSQIDLAYPDPWPKKKHFKRRFVNTANLDRFARVLAKDGQFRFASDIDSYINWTLLHVRESGKFDWLAECADDWHVPYPDWQRTRYEAKAVREGRKPAYLSFRKC